MAAVAKTLVTDSSCIFCKIVAGAIPARKLFETSKSVAFLDAFPISDGHVLVIPKHHAARLTELPVQSQTELLPIAAGLARKILPAVGAVDFNVLQNNGWEAHQRVDHVHVHMIPKPPVPSSSAAADGGAAETTHSETISAPVGSGLGVVWPSQGAVKEEVVEKIVKAFEGDDAWRKELLRELGEEDQPEAAVL